MPLGSEPDPLSAYEPSPFDGNQRRGEVVDMLEGKVSKTDANYLNPDKRKEAEQDPDINSSCIMCGHYLDKEADTSKCEVVVGSVAAEGICDMFDPSVGGQGVEPPVLMQ